MNPDTNKFEELLTEKEKKIRDETNKQLENVYYQLKNKPQLVRPNGEPVPSHWSIFHVGEKVVIKNYVFEIAYIDESTLLLKPIEVWQPEVGTNEYP